MIITTAEKIDLIRRMIADKSSENVDESQRFLCGAWRVACGEEVKNRLFSLRATRHPPQSLPLLTLLSKFFQAIKIKDLNLFPGNLDQIIIREFAQGA